MKMHSANEPGRPCGPAPGLSQLPGAAWAFFLLLLVGGTSALRAQSFTPVISQIIPAEDNSTYFDGDGDLPAVIFIKNNGDVTGTISNWSLTDNPAVPRKWIFPGGTVPITIPAGETIIVFASNKNKLTPPYATNFLLPCASTGYLYNPNSSLASQKLVTGENCPACISVFNANTLARWIIPTANNPASTAGDWRLTAFNDAGWNRGGPCFGYDSDPILGNMVLYSVFDTGTVDTTNRTITDVSGPILHTGTWPVNPTGGLNIGIPLNTLPKIIDNVAFQGPQNPNSYVMYAHHTQLEPAAANYTWSLWVRPLNPDLSSNEVLFRKGLDSSTGTAGYAMVRTPAGNVSMQLLMPGGPAPVVVTATTTGGLVPRDTWTHVLATVTRGSTSNLTLYINGTQRAQAVIPAGMTITTDTQNLPLYLARSIAGGAIMYTGRMDDFATWNRALSTTEITQVYNTGNAGKRIDDPTAPGASPAIYTPYIQTNVQTEMKGVNTSFYERVDFNITSPALIQSMILTMRYDDGFVAYINGVEIARRNAPSGALTFSSAAASDRADNLGLVAEQIPVPAAGIAALVAGVNTLAIHGLNFTASDQRFLICPDLCYDELTPEDCNITTNGRLFWITFPGNAPEELGNPLQLSVSITGASGTTGNVAIPGLGFSQNFSLPANGRTEVNLPKAASLDKSDTIEKKGVRITASANVAVVGKTRIDYSTDTFLAHPFKCLASNYLAVCYQNSWTGLPDLNGTQFGIVAIADNTHVTVRPIVTTGSHAAGVPYNFILNMGETYMLRNLNNTPADLSGSEITSDSPVAVFGGHKCANVTGQLFFQDTLLEQTLPVALWNTEYALAPLATRTAQELVRVVAGQNGVVISINGVAQAGTLNKGDKKDYIVSGGAVFSSNGKFLATHLSRSSDADSVLNADPFQLNCQPTASWLSGYRFATPVAGEFGGRYANLIARNAELAGVTVSPVPVVTGPVVAIPGTPYSYRVLTLAAGTVYTTSGRTHGLESYGWDEYDSYGNSGGMRFTDTQPATLGQAPPEITLFTTLVAGVGQRATMPDLRTYFDIHDNCCPDQSLSVSQNPQAGALLAAGDYGGSVTVRDCSGNSLTFEFVIHVRTDPRALAFPTQFGIPALEDTVWGWHANPDGDCLNNEQEYALGTNMAVNAPYGLAIVVSQATYQGQQGIEISFRRRNDDPSLDYTPEGSVDLNGWFSGLGHFEETSSGPDALPGFTRVRYFSYDSIDFSHFFLRLDIRRN